MMWLVLSLLFGIFPQSLYFMLFLTKIKDIKDKRILFLSITFVLLSLLVLIVQYNIYLYLMIIPMLYLAMKLLYKKKVQIIDVFVIAIAYGYLSFISFICSFIIKNNMALYPIAYIINNILLFVILFLSKRIIKAYRIYIKLWNRKQGNKIRSISIRNVSLILLNVFIMMLDVFITKVSMW